MNEMHTYQAEIMGAIADATADGWFYWHGVQRQDGGRDHEDGTAVYVFRDSNGPDSWIIGITPVGKSFRRVGLVMATDVEIDPNIPDRENVGSES